jgi:hypothetical protein
MDRYFYENAGFALRAPEGVVFFPIGADRICLMCGSVIACDFRSVHRSACELPRPFIVREYCRVLNVKLENVSPAEDPLASSSPSNS